MHRALAVLTQLSADDGDGQLVTFVFPANANGSEENHAAAEERHISIAGVKVKVCVNPSTPEYVPTNYLAPLESLSKDMIAHFKWIAQKDLLGQDIYLIGHPGPSRRRLAFAYCQLIGREVEYLSLTRDTSESDIKQRREIVNQTAIYIDQVAVSAAINGRILVLEGFVFCSFTHARTHACPSHLLFLFSLLLLAALACRH